MFLCVWFFKKINILRTDKMVCNKRRKSKKIDQNIAKKLSKETEERNVGIKIKHRFLYSVSVSLLVFIWLARM